MINELNELIAKQDTLRQTGRTTNMLKEALTLSGNVVIVFHNQAAARNAFRFYQEFLSPKYITALFFNTNLSVIVGEAIIECISMDSYPSLTNGADHILFDHYCLEKELRELSRKYTKIKKCHCCGQEIKNKG